MTNTQAIIWAAAIASSTTSLTWFMAKRWEISERRRIRYIETASKLCCLMRDDSFDHRQAVLEEITKLWIDGDLKVIKKAEVPVDAIIDGSDDAEIALRHLIVSMRRDVRLIWSRPLRSDKIKIRLTSSQS